MSPAAESKPKAEEAKAVPLEQARTRREMLEAEPYRFNLHALMRELERMHPDKPRIGKSQVLAQDSPAPSSLSLQRVLHWLLYWG